MKKEYFGKIDGREVYRYTLERSGIALGVLDFGATIQSLCVGSVNIVRSFQSADEYAKSDGYVCCAIGRVANRIAGGEFSLNAAKYRLTKNEGNNQLHGGAGGFHAKFYDVEEVENGCKMTYVSPDGEEGYPGRLVFSVTFTLAEKAVHIEYSALSDQDTIWAPTQHFYFNMNGPIGNANSNALTIYADEYTPVNAELIPIGKADVTGTPFDFRKGKRIACELEKVGLYDHNFLLTGSRAATLVGDISGLKMDVFTDMPAMQLYTGAGGKSIDDEDKGGVALEPQFTPNAINMQGFEKPILKANECKRHFIRLEF